MQSSKPIIAPGVKIKYPLRMITTHYHTVTHQPENNAIVADMVSMKIWGASGALRDCATMGVVRDGVLVGGVVFHDWRTETNTMQLSVAGEPCRWLTRSVINDTMRFAFDLMKVSAVYAMVSESNPVALKMDRAIFANEAYVPHMFGEGKGGYMLTLSEKEWRAHRLYRP